MTFLELCKRLRSEAGISGTGPVTTVGQTGQMLQVVEWVQEAYRSIQTEYETWRFLRTDFSISTIDGTQEYTPAAVSITDLGKWIDEYITLYSSVADEAEILYFPWEDFKRMYMHGTLRTFESRPDSFTFRPANNAFVFGPIPDAIYTVKGEYYKTADILSGDSDTPLFPSRFHMLVVWRALMLYAAKSAAPELYAHGENQDQDLMDSLRSDQLDEIKYGEPLA